MNASAIVFQQPCQLSVRSLPLRATVDGDVEVEVSHSGISTGTERLLWDGSMPPFPGMGYPLVPGYETVGRVVRTHGACGSGQSRQGDRFDALAHFSEGIAALLFELQPNLSLAGG